MPNLCEGLMGDLFQPAKPTAHQDTTIAAAELMALANKFSQIAAKSHRDAVIITYQACAQLAEERAAALRDGAPPHV